MPSPPRDLDPGLRHVWVGATGNERYYADLEDRVVWLALLRKVLVNYGWTCLAFCQLSTHVHLVIDVPDRSLALGMKQLNMAYSRHFNDRHEREGQFVRRRYGSRRIADGRDLLGAYAYVVANPVTARLCARPEDWRWSSYASTIGISDDFPFIDASVAIAEAGGTPSALRRMVNSRQAAQPTGSAMAGV